jgi:hypothetical protein
MCEMTFEDFQIDKVKNLILGENLYELGINFLT